MRNPCWKSGSARLIAAAFVIDTAALAQVPTAQQLGVYAFPAKNQEPAGPVEPARMT